VLINRGYRFLLDPSAAQAMEMAAFSGVCRLIYNLALEQRRDFHRQFRRSTGAAINYLSQARELTELRSQYDWIRAVSQTAQQQALRDLDTAFRRFFEGVAEYPRPRRKGLNDAFRFQGREVTVVRLNRSWGSVRLPKIGAVRFRWTREVPNTFKNVTVSRDVLGWHVSFSVEIEIEAPRNALPTIGIDRGIVHALALSDGTFIDAPRASLKKLDARARRHAQQVARCRRGSNRHRKAKARLASTKAETARVRRHFNHVASARIASSYGIVVIEALQVRNMTTSAKGIIQNPGSNVRQKTGLNRSILDMGWSQFATFLMYKLVAAGGELRTVAPQHTSTTCSCCGGTDKSHRKSQAVYECAGCGSVMNADINAARNILRAGTRPAQRPGRQRALIKCESRQEAA
jgi:putative transposase